MTLLVRDWRISIHFACFCFWMTRKFGFKLQSSHVIDKRYKEVLLYGMFNILITIFVRCKKHLLHRAKRMIQYCCEYNMASKIFKSVTSTINNALHI